MQLTVKDVARLLNRSERTIRSWVDERGLPACRVNNQLRFNRIDLIEWAATRNVSVPPELLYEAAPDAGDLPSLVEALGAGGVVHGLKGQDKESVLHAVVRLLRLPDHVDREFLFQMLSAREALGSTGVGEGIAIPHPRNPIVLSVAQPTVTLCFLEQAIDFGALDGVPVCVVFTLISPTVRTHLHLLSRLAFALHDAEFRGALARQAGRDEILACAQRAEAGLRRPAAAG